MAAGVVALCLAAADSGRASKARVDDHMRAFDLEAQREELHRVESYVGGATAEDAFLLEVRFHAFSHVRKHVNPRWRDFREMVEDMQKMLLTGGVKTNVFKLREPDSIMCVLNDADQLRQATEFFAAQGEVLDAMPVVQKARESPAPVTHTEL